MPQTATRIVVSLQGPHAVGKSSLLNRLRCLDDRFTCRSETVEELEERKRADKLDLEKCQDFCTNQRRFIEWEVARYQSYQDGQLVIVDRGPDTTEFFTCEYPRIIGTDWDIEGLMARDLLSLRACRADRVLYLCADEDTVLKRASRDTHSRPTLLRWLKYFEPAARKWFQRMPTCTFLDTSHMCADDVASWAHQWICANCGNVLQ